MIKIFSFITLLFSFGFAFGQTNDVKDHFKKSTNLVVQQPDASMLNQEINNKTLYDFVAKKSVLFSVAPFKNSEEKTGEATKKSNTGKLAEYKEKE